MASKKKDKNQRIRSYELKCHTNEGKADKIFSVLKEYRPLAVSISNHHWFLFHKKGKLGFSDFEDIKHIKTNLSERYKQTCQTQVVGQLKSYISNVQNRFIDVVQSVGGSIDEQTRIKLFYINKYELWQQTCIFMREELLDQESIKLARHIFKRLTKNKPNLSHCNMVLDKKVCAVTPRKENDAVKFDYWANISTLEFRKKIDIPLQTNYFFEHVGGIFKNVVQINEKDGILHFSLVKQLSKQTIKFCSEKLGIDIGMVVMIATEHGDLLGVKLMERLKNYDEITSRLIKNLQKQGIKPSENKRYNKLIEKIRHTIKNEVGRIFNRLVKRYSPKEIVAEKLNFQKSNLGKKTNRLLHKFGKQVIENKLVSISEMTGIKITKVPAPYTSQECPECHYTHKNNRKTRDLFVCQCCGYTRHADVVGGKNVSGRTAEFENLNKYQIRQLLSEKHDNWCELHRRNRPAKDLPRKVNCPKETLTEISEKKDLLMVS